ncbi:four helix bundle protein [bacterium]|nr:four helix bundle protein [bacterium]
MARDLRSYRGLLVWQQGMRLTQACYHLTRGLPKEERYGLASQMWRAAISVPANIAEGSGRGTRKDFVNFLRIAQGSLRELETYLLLLPTVHLASSAQVLPLLRQVDSIARLLNRLIQSLQRPRA